jgi:hypothetical protein
MAREEVTTPVGVAIYPKISSPDTYGPKADGKYKTDIGFTREAFAAFQKKVEALAKEEYPKQKVKWKTKDQEDGLISIRASSKYQPAIFDSKNQDIAPDSVKIGGGSRIRGICGVNFYDANKTNVTVSFYLNQVQLIELKEYQRGPAKSGFDEVEDGFVSDDNSGTDEGDDTPAETNESGFDTL